MEATTSTECSAGDAASVDLPPMASLVAELSDLCLRSQHVFSGAMDQALTELLLKATPNDSEGLQGVAMSMHASVQRIGGSAHKILSCLQLVGTSEACNDVGTSEARDGDCLSSGTGSPERERRRLGAESLPAPPLGAKEVEDSSPSSPQPAPSPVLTVEDLKRAEGTAESSMRLCRRFSMVAKAAVQSLSTAGSSLQHLVARKPGKPRAGITGLVGHEDLAVQRLARCMMTALGALSVALVDIATSLSVDVLQPLEALQGTASALRNRKRSELEVLRQRRQGCTDTITASLHKSQEFLQAAKEAAGEGLFGWLTSAGSSEAELRRLQHAEESIVGEQREQLMALVHTEQVMSVAMTEGLRQLEQSTKEAMMCSLANFPGACASIVSVMHLEMQDLRESS